MPEAFLGLILIGLIAGLASGMFGIGGGVVIVPALMIFMGLGQLDANGISLTARLVPVGIFAAIAYWRAGKLRLMTAFLIAIGVAFGSYFGAEVANGLPQQTLKQVYGIFLLYVAWRFGEPRKLYRKRTQAAANNSADNNASNPIEEEPEERLNVAWYWLMVLGFAAGITAGMFGIGGGVVIVPALVALLNFEQKRAVGTSLAVLQFPAGLPAVLVYFNNPENQITLTQPVLVGLGLIFGTFAGARIALGLPSGTVKRLYAVFLLFVALHFLGVLKLLGIL